MEQYHIFICTLCVTDTKTDDLYFGYTHVSVLNTQDNCTAIHIIMCVAHVNSFD